MCGHTEQVGGHTEQVEVSQEDFLKEENRESLWLAKLQQEKVQLRLSPAKKSVNSLSLKVSTYTGVAWTLPTPTHTKTEPLKSG